MSSSFFFARTQLFLVLCATTLSLLVLLLLLVDVHGVESTQILAVKSQVQGSGSIQNNSLVGITLDENGFLQQETVIFAGQAKHRMAFPNTNTQSQQIIVSYSPGSQGLFPATMIYTGSINSSSSSFQRLTTNDPNNITEIQAVLSNDGQKVFYSAAMADSWYGNNVSDTSRLAMSDNSGANFEWMFFENLPYNYMFNQWCPTLDPTQNILYFVSDLCDPVSPCLYAIDLSQTNSNGEYTIEMVLSQAGGVGCPRPYEDENGSGLLLTRSTGNSNQKKKQRKNNHIQKEDMLPATIVGTFDSSSRKFKPLLEVPQVTTASATEADQFFDCSVAQFGKSHICVHALGRSLITLEWNGFGILSRIATGNFDIGLTSPDELIFAYSDPCRVLDA